MKDEQAKRINLPTEARLKLARAMLEATCNACGAGYLVVMFVPGSDMVLRSFHGLDTPDECKAMGFEVTALMAKHAHALLHATPPAPHSNKPAS